MRTDLSLVVAESGILYGLADVLITTLRAYLGIGLPVYRIIYTCMHVDCGEFHAKINTENTNYAPVI